MTPPASSVASDNASVAPHSGSIFTAAPARQAMILLRTVFTIAPIAFGLDKFFNLLTDWPHYLAPVVTDILPLTGQQFMYIVGVVEIIAGLLVLWKPRWGALVVAIWLAGIIIDLLVLGSFFDVALRDFGLFVAALALFRLTFSPAATAHAK
ncbi:DoxX family membrane protein [Parafrigoribacterium humi]|uniref:DoxX family membrane protein n=1 Tax=Parafrigoribacterium humi TaxID=3144664 RepID=UPI0032EAC9D5